MSQSIIYTTSSQQERISITASCEHCHRSRMSPTSAGDLEQYSNVITQNAETQESVRVKQQSPDSPRTVSSPFIMGPPAPYSVLQLDSAADVSILKFHREHVVPFVFRPRCHLVYHMALSKNHHGNQFPPLKHALLATAAIRLASQQPEYYAPAADHYSKAVRGLKEALDQGHLNGSEDFFLETVTWLGFYEAKIPGHLGNAATHFATSVKLFGIRRRNRRCKCQHQLLEKLLAETTLFACSTLALFDPIMASIPLSSLRRNIGPILAEIQAPTKSSMVDSPFLGLPAELYFLMFELSQQFHRQLSEALSTTLKMRELFHRLRLMDNVAGNGSSDPLYEPHMQHGSYDRSRLVAYQLHIKACLALVTFWLQREEEGPAFNAETLVHLQQGLGMLTAANLGEMGRNYDITWPIKTMGGMLRSRHAIGALQDVLGSTARYKDCDQFRCALEQLNAMWVTR